MKARATRARLWAVVLMAMAALVAFVLWSTNSPSPEEQLRRKIVRMARAAERRDAAEILNEISADFHSDIAPTRAVFAQWLTAELKRNTWVRVFPMNVTVELNGPSHAKLHGSVVFGQSSAERPQDLPKTSEIRGYFIDAKAVKEQDNEWRFVEVSSEAVRSSELF